MFATSVETHITILQLVHEIQISIALTVGSWFMLFPFKMFVKKIVGAWNEQEEILKSVKEELITQRTNCLKTLQEQGTKQIEVLEKMSDTLDSMRTSQAEMSGFLKGGLR